MELLSPAGSPKAVTAAVQSGADAVYLGFGEWNAHRSTKNFTPEEAEAAVCYCHLRGVRVYLALNTCLTDRELSAAAQVAAKASDLGVDAVIVQDLGVARMLRQAMPEMPLHGSARMSVHSLDGVKAAADVGMERVALARELPRNQLEHICLHAPIQVETFVHGSLCISYSGQCYFSAVMGSPSGNRGVCAQPCRLPYGWERKADGYPLSLKEVSLAEHLKELRRMGISCLKIGGRMKRPEYVAIVTGVYARAMARGQEPAPQELEQLERVCSRQGFTQGYFLGRKGADMFGVGQEERPPQELYVQAKAGYEGGENRKTPVVFYADIRGGRPARVAAEDQSGHLALAEGPPPEQAVSLPLTAEKVEAQLGRTGGTPYICNKVVARVEPGLSMPLSALNTLRRQALDELSRQRVELPRRRTAAYRAGVRHENRKTPPVMTLALRRAGQLSAELLSLTPTLVYLPMEELTQHPETIGQIQRAGVELCAILPRISWDSERQQVCRELEQLQARGVSQVLAGTLDGIFMAKRLGLGVRGDYGLNLLNSQSLKELKRLGLRSATLSLELRLAQIRDLNKNMDTELLVYGRLPVMITENCVIQNRGPGCACEKDQRLVDRKGERFPVVKAPGCRNEMFGSRPLFLADRAKDYQNLGLWGARLSFLEESARECVRLLRCYRGTDQHMPGTYTRGLYYRGGE